jgi:molybdopterin-synthase adenylyltransferase
MAERATAVVLGAGGIGGAALLTLAAGGAARLVLLDGAAVAEPDLALSPLLGEADLGARRVQASAAALRARFPAAEVEAVDAPLAAADLGRLLQGAGAVVEAAGEPADKLRAGEAAARAGVALVHAAVLRASAQLLTVRPGGPGGCLRCLFEEAPAPGAIPAAAVAGVLGAVAALAGALAGAEALRLLAGAPGAYEGRLLTLDARGHAARLLELRRRPGCPVCGGPAAGPAEGA